MKTVYSVSELPQVLAVYAMFGGKGRGRYLAYVGIADKLKRRVAQHLIRRDSSITTGTSAAASPTSSAPSLRPTRRPRPARLDNRLNNGHNGCSGRTVCNGPSSTKLTFGQFSAARPVAALCR